MVYDILDGNTEHCQSVQGLPRSISNRRVGIEILNLKQDAHESHRSLVKTVQINTYMIIS